MGPCGNFWKNIFIPNLNQNNLDRTHCRISWNILFIYLFYGKKEKLQRQNISELDVFRYYIKLLQKMRDLGQDDIRQIN